MSRRCCRADFCRGVLSDLDVTVDIAEGSQMPDPTQRRVIIVSNHPLGGLDGMALIARHPASFASEAGTHYGVQVQLYRPVCGALRGVCRCCLSIGHVTIKCIWVQRYKIMWNVECGMSNWVAHTFIRVLKLRGIRELSAR